MSDGEFFVGSDGLDQYRYPDGQPKISISMETRIALDVRLCEPEGPHTGQASRCPGNECGRIAFRNMGDGPWVDCLCGERFNTNFSFIGHVPWPWPDSGVCEVEG